MKSQLEIKLQKHVEMLITRYPKLEVCRQSIIDAYLLLQTAYEGDHKLLAAGNGGSAAD